MSRMQRHVSIVSTCMGHIGCLPSHCKTSLRVLCVGVVLAFPHTVTRETQHGLRNFCHFCVVFNVQILTQCIEHQAK